MNISNKDKFIMMNILNQSTSNLPKHPRRLSVFPERFPLYGDVSCYIELDKINEIEDTWDNYNMMDFLHYTSFAASLFTSTHKKNITLTIQDFCTINCKNVFLLKGIIPSNSIEENCHLFVFKNSICHVNHESINYNESTSTQANTNKSVLIGYCDIKYYKDRYITLSEFLIHSVYDTKSLANEIGKHFSPYEYLRNFAHSPLDRDIVDNSPFRNFYLNFFNNQTTCRDNLTLDDNLVKSFRHIEIPKDWSLLGQNSASNKKLLRENLLHFAARHNLKKFCSIIINLPGSFEGLECLNLDGELPCQLAIKKKHKKIALLMFDFYSKNEKLSCKMSLTSSPRTKSKLAQKYSAISSLMSMPPLPHNLHHNPHHHHQNHHQSNLSIFDIKHFSSNLSTADPNETMDSPTETIKQSIFTDRPISTEDVIIVDDDDQIVLPIKNLSREIKSKLKSSNESLYSKIYPFSYKLAKLNSFNECEQNFKKFPDASDSLAAKTNSAKPPQLGILKKHRNTSTSSMPEESKRVLEKHMHKLTSDSHKSESMRLKLDTSDPTSYKPRSLLRNKTRIIRKAAENKEEIYCQINDDYEELNENSIYEDIDSDGSELDNTSDEGEHLGTNNDVESDGSIDLSCFDTAKENKKIDDTEPNGSKIMCSVKQAPKPKNKIAKLFNTFSNSLQQESALLPPLPRHSILPQSITVAPLTNSQNDFDRNLNTRRSKRFTKPSNLAIQEISISSNNSPNNSSSCSPVSTSGSAAINLQKAASTPSIFDKIKNDNKAKYDDSNDKIGLSTQSTFSSSSLNTVDSNKNNKNEVKNQKLNKRCEHNLKLSQHKTESAPSTQLPLFQTENCANSNECQFLSSSASKHLGPVDTGSPSSKKELVTVNEFLKEFEMAQKNGEISQVEEPAYLIPLGASTATSSKSSLVSQVTTEPATVFTSPVNRSPNSATSYDQLILQQSTPLKNQLDSHAKALSKSKKLGNILKLASVRGAKSKSMKHKYSSQIHQHAFVSKTVTSETTCDTCQKSLLNKKALICKNCQIMIHDSPCKDQEIQCLFYKKSIFSQSKSNSSSSTSAFNINKVKIANDDKTKLDETDDRDNLIASGYSSGGIIVGLNGLNPSNSIKTIHITNNRPKSMDISKYFQNTKKAHLSKSTSNMYRTMQESAAFEKNKKMRTHKTKRPKSAFGPLLQSSDSLNASLNESLNNSVNGTKSTSSTHSIQPSNMNLLRYLTKADSKTSLNELFSLANRLDSNSYSICTNKKYLKNLNTSSNSSLNLFLKSSSSTGSSTRRFFYRNSKSINEECADYEAIKSLRESTDSLNYKLESEANLNPTNSSSSMINSVLNQNTVSSNGSSSSSASIFSGTGLNSNFNFYMNELNAEFYNFELEFSANNWADLQDKDYLQSLSRQLRNKQENIFEFIKTEVNYYKILCMCQRMFKNILINDCRIESKILEQIFPDLERLMDLHKVLLDQLIDRYRSSKNKYIDYIGDILSNILSEKNEMWVSLYSKVCCSHVTAKQTFKQLSTSNKAVASFSIEISKHSWLKRYHIPDCLTIITQRLTKYLTLIENILTNSQDDKIEIDLLNKSLENLRSILSRVNDAVAFYQNYNEFKKYLDNFDQKSQTKSFVKYEKNIEERAFTKSDLTSKPNRKIISLNQVTVKVMSMKGKEYKNVTCVTMNDMIVFLQYNEKSSKYTFMNDTKSVIICNYGILIRPKETDLNHLQSQSSQIHHQRTVSQSNSMKLNQTNANSGQSASTKSYTHESLITYIAHTITNEIFEVKFPDEISRNQWLILVHTHITPFIEVNKENVEDKVTTSEPRQDELTISSDIAGLICTFNNLLSNHMTVNLMRSASSAGETITKTSQDNQISIPKRAETFNGASSSKESQMSIININSELFQKSKVFQTYSPKNCDTLSTTTNTESDYSTTTNKSADSGYQSKSCCIYADLDQSISACVCSDKADGKNAFFDENTLQSMPRNSFEQMLRTILNDYTKTKKENFELKKSIENKDKSIDLLKKALDEYKVQLDSEKQDLEKKFIDLEKKENLDATSGTANITRLSHNISQSSNNIQINNQINSTTQSNQSSLLADSNHNSANSQSMSNKVSIMVKCERSLLSSNAQVKKEDDKNGSDSSILFL